MTGVRRAANIVALFSVVYVGAGCRRQPEALASPPGPSPLAIRLDHLQHLGLNAVVRGHPVRVVSLYAEAPDYRPTGSPARDGYEGIASLDDAARAAVVYLRAYETTGDTRARDEALGLLAFVVGMEQGDGEFVNFIDAQGRPNRNVASGRKSMSYWAARSIWALGEAVRVLGPRDSTELKTVRPVLDRAVNRMAREIDAGHLIGGSATPTAEALLGLLALQRAEPSSRIAALAARTAGLLVPLSMGSVRTPPWGARVDRPGETWHAWGSRSTAALAEAALVLNRPDFAAAARREADALWGRFLLAGQLPSAIASGPTNSAVAGTTEWFPQIAYGIGPIVEGYLALADATGEREYAVFAGLAAGWFVGANPARVNMYDEKTGRTFDGIDGPAPLRVNRNSGAESTIEALLALQSVESNPEAAEYIHYRAVGAPASSLASVPERREYAGSGHERLVVRR